MECSLQTCDGKINLRKKVETRVNGREIEGFACKDCGCIHRTVPVKDTNDGIAFLDNGGVVFKSQCPAYGCPGVISTRKVVTVPLESGEQKGSPCSVCRIIWRGSEPIHDDKYQTAILGEHEQIDFRAPIR